MNVFHVCDPRGRAVTDARDFAAVEETLRRALQTELFDFSPLLDKTRRQTARKRPQGVEFPTLITIDNKAHPTYTLIQIQTADRIGLLHDLLECFGHNAVTMALSRISTESGAAMDTFYVTDSANRGKITDANRINTLQSELHAAVLLNSERS